MKLGEEHERALSDTRATHVSRLTRVRTGIEWLVSGVEQGDCLFFHYSGHGGQMKDADCRAEVKTPRIDRVRTQI